MSVIKRLNEAKEELDKLVLSPSFDIKNYQIIAEAIVSATVYIDKEIEKKRSLFQGLLEHTTINPDEKNLFDKALDFCEKHKIEYHLTDEDDDVQTIVISFNGIKKYTYVIPYDKSWKLEIRVDHE